MSKIKPYSGSSIDRLVNMLNASGNASLNLGVDYTFGNYTTIYASNQWNTKIRIIPIDNVTYIDQYLFYTRLSLEALTRLPAGELETVTIPKLPFKIHDILDDINLALGLNLLPSEVANEEHTKIKPKYPLRIRTNASVAWVPSIYNFNAIISSPIDFNYRILEDGTPLSNEDGSLRLMEAGFVPVA